MRIWLLLMFGWCFGVSVASADVIDPREGLCNGKSKGDVCEGYGTKGTCQTAQCCRNDYSQGTPPKTVCNDCLKCKPGEAPKPEPAKPAVDPAMPDGAKPVAKPEPAKPAVEPKPAEKAPEKVAPKPAEKPTEKAAEKPADKAAGKAAETASTPAPKESAGCFAGPGAPGSWGLGALFAGLLLAGTLRRTRR
ncbi:MAG: hypothetical protein ACE366_07380 [Bradymonadia bacterium]